MKSDGTQVEALANGTEAFTLEELELLQAGMVAMIFCASSYHGLDFKGGPGPNEALRDKLSRLVRERKSA
jgi:hypothetical protein